MAWLGAPLKGMAENVFDEETLIWQEWVMDIIEGLRQVARSSGPIPWERLPIGLAACLGVRGEASWLARTSNVSEAMLSQWRKQKRTPSFSRVLELCYALDISPFQLMTNDPVDLREAIQSKSMPRRPRPKRPKPPRMDRARAREFIQAVLDGREALLAVRQIERQLGLGSGTLADRFPQECALISAKYLAYQSQLANERIALACDEARRATFMLYAKEMNPKRDQVKAMLTEPNMMRRPLVQAAWHSARHELGLE